MHYKKAFVNLPYFLIVSFLQPLKQNTLQIVIWVDVDLKQLTSSAS